MLQMLYSVRSERLLMEEIDYSIVFRWFIGSVPSTLKCSSETSPPLGSAIGLPGHGIHNQPVAILYQQIATVDLSPN